MRRLLRKLLSRNEVFLSKRLSPLSRFWMFLGVLCIGASFFFPLWNIHLEAPQYRDGLDLFIYSYQLEAGNDGRDLNEINILNHYIGMRPIEEADFVEMVWMPFALGFFMLFALRGIVFGLMGNLVDNMVLYVYFTLFAGGTFVYRMYTYGHDLDPAAPINPDPFMPVLLGTQQIANFTQTSMPLAGSYLLCGYLVCLLLAAFHSRREPGIYVHAEEAR